MTLVVLSVVLVLALCVLGLCLGPREPRNDPALLANPAFTTIYADVSPIPLLKTSWSYGYPAFEVTFQSKVQMEAAAPLNAAFKRELGQIFRSYGVVDRPFDAELATFFTYPGHIEEILGRSRQSM